jgi:hypothetical protein
MKKMKNVLDGWYFCGGRATGGDDHLPGLGLFS